MYAPDPVLFFGTQDDPHLELVCEHFRDGSMDNFIVVDVTKLTPGISYRYDENQAWPTTTYNGGPLTLRGVKRVWYRRTNIRKLRPNLRISPPEQYEYAMASMQSLHIAMTLLVDPDAFWVSDRRAIFQAEQKPYHMGMARLAGFSHIPPAIFTSDPSEAERFLRQYPDFVMKPMAPIPPTRDRDQPTMRKPADQLELKGLTINPHIFQQRIEPKFEVRLAVVGNEVFACGVADKDEASSVAQDVRDFRSAFLKGTFDSWPVDDVPEEIAQASVALVKNLGLTCGYFDFIVDKHGTWWFIEVNPNGQWAFMHETVRDRIAQAIARLLERGAVA